MSKRKRSVKQQEEAKPSASKKAKPESPGKILRDKIVTDLVEKKLRTTWYPGLQLGGPFVMEMEWIQFRESNDRKHLVVVAHVLYKLNNWKRRGAYSAYIQDFFSQSSGKQTTMLDDQMKDLAKQ